MAVAGIGGLGLSGGGGGGSMQTLTQVLGQGNTSSGLDLVMTLGDDLAIGGVLATTATAGFLRLPTTAGVPTGVPTGFVGTSSTVIDSSSHVMYFYSGGAWHAVESADKTLAQVLATGNATGGTDLFVTDGDAIDFGGNGNLSWNVTDSEIQSSVNFYAPEVRTDTSTFKLDNAVDLSTNSRRIEIIDNARAQNTELIGFDWDATGSTAPTYPSLAAEATAPIQTLEDATDDDFTFTIAVALDNKTVSATYKPTAAGTATFKVQFTDVSGVNLVSQYTQVITVPEIGTEVIVPLPNPISMNAGEFTFITYSGPALAGHVYAADPTFGTGFYPWLSLTFNAITEQTLAVVAGVDKNVQFNDGGVMGGTAGFTFDKVTGKAQATQFQTNPNTFLTTQELEIRALIAASVVGVILRDNLGGANLQLRYHGATDRSELLALKPLLIQTVGGDLTIESGLNNINLLTPALAGKVLINGDEAASTADVLTDNFLVAGADGAKLKSATGNDVAGAFITPDGTILSIRAPEDSVAGFALKSFADGFVTQLLYSDLNDAVDFFTEAATVNFETTGILNIGSSAAMNLTSGGVMKLDATGKLTLKTTTSVDIESDQSNLIAFLNMETKGTNGSKINVAMGNVHPTGNVTLQPGEVYLFRDLTAGELTDIFLNAGDGIGPNNNRYLSMRAAADIAFTNNDIGTSTTPKWLRHGGVDPAASTLVTSWVASRAGMLQNFSAHHAKPGVGAVLITYTVYVNGSPTALTVSVMANSTATVSDILNRVWINQFDRVSVQVTKAAAITTSPDVIETTMEYQ